jgi:hypothetical protein
MPPLIRRSQSAVPRHADEDGGRSDAHPLPPRQVPGSLAGAVTSTVFMLAPRCTGRSRSWPFARQDPPIGSVNLMPFRGDPDEVRARLSEHIPLRRYGSPRSSAGRPRSCSPPAASRITGAMIPVDGGAVSSISWPGGAPGECCRGTLASRPGGTRG